jgi:two-component system, NtrC family, nitrogen regulation sensor histidine kinase GlnL
MDLNRAAADLFDGSIQQLRSSALIDISPSLEKWRRRLDQSEHALSVLEAHIERDDVNVDATFQRTTDGVLIEIHPITERVRQRELADRADRQQGLAMMSHRLSHELRNPLAGVRGAAQLIEAATREEDRVRHARMIQREVDRITSLIERFAGNPQPRSGPANLHRILDEAAELIQAEHGGGLELIRQFDPSIPELDSDSAQLHQMFLNLMRNSLQANASTIRLTTRIEHHSPLIDGPARHAVRIDVDDDGNGVPTELRDRLFLPLVSGRDRGSGFGLAVVQQIARGHGGLVEYQPLDSGSRFRVRLPLLIWQDGPRG